MSRVDGSSSEADIAAATGLEVQAVSQTIARLLALGAIEVRSKAEPAPRAHRAPMPSSSQFGASVEERVVHSSHHPGAKLYDPRELEEPADLDETRKRVILDTFYRLERLDHYELLGVPRGADKKAIRTRYHEVINVYHPDRYYGKQLGSFKAKLERIFQRVTEAHDVLSRSEARADYDSYLNAGLSTRELEEQLKDEEAVARELEAVRARIEAEAQHAGANTAPPVATGSAGGVPRATPVVAGSSLPPRASPLPSMPPSDAPRTGFAKSDAESRRRALARKLGLSAPPPAPDTRPSPTPSPQERSPQESTASHERAAQDLKRRYEQRMVDAGRRQVDEYVARAEAALAKKQLVDAVNALRIAVSLAPNDVALRQRLEDLQSEASRELAGRYLEQAQYEEREHHWPEAVRSYARVLQGAPSPQLHERLAFCLLAAQGDMKQAVEHARKAVLGAPNESKYRQTLARAYAAANMKESALGELERASALSPGDDTIKEQIRRARRGEF
ncbi:MAG TPA: DnaJ domain-containing protein [Polyangiaceae bacterium]|nr:DnaJ domain-containing protein [Polyangiaceae bacterium]